MGQTYGIDIDRDGKSVWVFERCGVNAYEVEAESGMMGGSGSADFLAPAAAIPTAKQVFGAEVEAKADGSIYKMVRFTKAGYWLSYNRTGGASPLTTVTLQKIQ